MRIQFSNSLQFRRLRSRNGKDSAVILAFYRILTALSIHFRKIICWRNIGSTTHSNDNPRRP